MSKKLKKNKRPFNYTSSVTKPKLPKVKTEWNLKQLYYTSETDPRIEKDLKIAEKKYKNFALKWSTNKRYLTKPKVLAEALTEYEKLVSLPEASRAGRYFNFRSVLNAKDSVAEKNLSQLSQRLRKVSDEVMFFTLEIGKLPKKTQKEFLTHPQLANFKYYLERVWIAAEHFLSESEEKIISLKGGQSHGRWIQMVDKIISNRTIPFKGKDVPCNEALELLDQLSSADKKVLWTRLMEEMEVIGEVAEHEFNAIITDTWTEDELRGYKKPYSATALSYEDTEKSIENLVAAVSTKGFELSKEFYTLKAKYHGVKKLHYTRKYDSIGDAPVIPFSQAVEICRDVFYGVKPEYGKIFDGMLQNGQIDVYPKAGKRGGAFMSESIGHPTHVFLNHLDNFKSLETLAHEMGHAIHAERGKKQRPLYQGHSITTAETVSTLFENLLFDAVYEQAQEKDKAVLLHDRVARDIATIQRQIACFNCELEIHTTIKGQGGMTNHELRDCMYRHLKAYVGPAIEMSKMDGYSYVYWSHLRYGFYVYTYTFGILMSTIMADNYKANNSYIKEIDAFLTAGESANVASIFKSIGIDTTKKNTFTQALKNHEADINAFKVITDRKSKK